MTVETETIDSQKNVTSKKFMTFTLSGECYGISILLVEEVIGTLPITPIPNTPTFVNGVINLRGRIIPVIDLRVKLHMATTDLDKESCILILKIPIRNGIFNIGIVVESIHDIREVAETQISPAPNFGVKVNTMFLDGIVKEGKEQALLLLNAVKALTSKDVDQLQDLANSATIDK